MLGLGVILAVAVQRSWKDGVWMIAISSLLLLVSILEIALRKRAFSGVMHRTLAWAGRFFALGTWCLMLSAGISWLALPERSPPWEERNSPALQGVDQDELPPP